MIGPDKVYLGQTADFYTSQQQAGLFTEKEWQNWGRWSGGLEREEIPEDQAMRLVDAPRLPGLE